MDQLTTCDIASTMDVRGEDLPHREEFVVEVQRGNLEIVEKLAPEWHDLCNEGPCNQPFYWPEWFAAFVRAFEAGRPLVIITVRTGGRLQAVMPMVEEEGKSYGLRLTKLRSIKGYHSLRFDLVHGAGVNQQVVQASIWKCLQGLGHWDVIKMCEVPEAGAAYKLLELAASDGYPTGRWLSLRSPYIPLIDDRPAACEPRNLRLRSKLRRVWREVGAQNSCRLVRVDHADPEALERFYELEAAGWKGQRGSAIACQKNVRQFYEELALTADLFGNLSLYFLEFKGQTIAAHYGLTVGNRYYMPKCAYNEDFRVLAPGHLIVRAILEDLRERGISEFDFTGPLDNWKSRWTMHVRPQTWCYIYRQNFRGRLVHAIKFGVIPAAKKIRSVIFCKRRNTISESEH